MYTNSQIADMPPDHDGINNVSCQELTDVGGHIPQVQWARRVDAVAAWVEALRQAPRLTNPVTWLTAGGLAQQRACLSLGHLTSLQHQPHTSHAWPQLTAPGPSPGRGRLGKLTPAPATPYTSHHPPPNTQTHNYEG